MLVPWTRQPPGTAFVGLDPQNPLAQGIVGGIDSRGFSLVGRGVTRVGTVNAVAPRQGGIALIGNNAGLMSEAFSGSIGYPFTIIAVVSNITQTANSNFLAAIGGSGGNQFTGFGASTAGSVSGLKLTHRASNGAGTIERQYSTYVAATATGPVVLSATINSASSIDVYYNGVLDNGTLVSFTSGTIDYNRLALGGIDRSSDVFADTGNDVLLCFVTSKGWTAKEHFNYAKNPWQIFRPIVVPVKAPAAGAYTLTADNAAWNFAAQDAALKVARKLTAANAPWEFAAQSAGLTVARKITADNAAWEFAAQDATLTYAPAGAYTLVADSADWQFSVPDATLTYSGATTRRRGAAKPLRKGYIIRGKKYFLTDDELAIMVALELETIKRSDIKVPTKGRIKPIPAATFQMVKAVAKKMDELAEIGSLEDDDDEEEELLSMLL